MDMGLLTINTLNEIGFLGNPDTGIQRPTDRSHWMAPDHVFCEVTAVGMITKNSDYYCIYKTDFEIWRKIEEFEHQNFSIIQPPLDSTPIDRNTKNIIKSHLDSTPIGTKTPDPKALTRTTDFSNRKGKVHVPEDPESAPSSSDLS